MTQIPNLSLKSVTSSTCDTFCLSLLFFYPNSFFCAQFSHCVSFLWHSRCMYFFFIPFPHSFPVLWNILYVCILCPLIFAFRPILMAYSTDLYFFTTNFRILSHSCNIFFIYAFLCQIFTFRSICVIYWFLNIFLQWTIFLFYYFVDSLAMENLYVNF